MMRFGAFLITFNRPKGLRQTLKGILNQTRPPDLTLVVDNGNANATEHIVQDFSHHNVFHHPMRDNLGPAGAAAYAIQWLAQEGYDWIGWGDDNDPPPLPDVFERLLKVAATANKEAVGGVGAVGARWDWEKGKFERLPDQALHGVINVDSIGGSYLIQNSKVIQSAGLPDARLFFGLFDPEYCLRIKRANYGLLVDGDLMREYRERAGRLNLKVKQSVVSRYPYDSIWQRYYRTRNYIFMMNETFQRPDLARREVLKALGRVLGSWRRGPTYGTAFTYLQLRGILDGYLGRMGRTVTPKVREGKIF